MGLTDVLENTMQGRVVNPRCDSCGRDVEEGGTIYIEVVYDTVSARESPKHCLYTAESKLLKNNFGWCQECYKETSESDLENILILNCELSVETLLPVVLNSTIQKTS